MKDKLTLEQAFEYANEHPNETVKYGIEPQNRAQVFGQLESLDSGSGSTTALATSSDEEAVYTLSNGSRIILDDSNDTPVGEGVVATA